MGLCHDTPYNELALIRAGNNAAGIALAGALVGLALPVASALRSALHVYDIVIWGGAALLLQLTAYGIFHVVLRGAPDAMPLAGPARRCSWPPPISPSAC